MSNIVIKADNLGKCYIIGHEKHERYATLRDVMVNKVKNISGKSRQILKGDHLIAGNELEEYWALKHLTFEIKQGDRVGIIGRNGAGKSTLLKVLSRITEPSTGKVQIKGRVASLLEVGTGFHPELTGRENIFLNGAILGMSRFEIRKKFDEIVNFSGVEKFLDTPVKRYSSGMYVRLAFAVAAHLEPEILVVDEVLAVGDADFQKKCLGKMEDVSTKEGRTVLFVSHNMSAIKALCNESILLNEGKIEAVGDTFTIAEKYSHNYIFHGEQIRTTTDKIDWLGVTNIEELQKLKPKDNIEIQLHFNAKQSIQKFFVDFAIYQDINQFIVHTRSKHTHEPFKVEGGKEFTISLKINTPNLMPGKYYLTVYVYNEEDVLFWVDYVDIFYIQNVIDFGVTEFFDGIRAIILPEYSILIN